MSWFDHLILLGICVGSGMIVAGGIWFFGALWGLW